MAPFAFQVVRAKPRWSVTRVSGFESASMGGLRLQALSPSSAHRHNGIYYYIIPFKDYICAYIPFRVIRVFRGKNSFIRTHNRTDASTTDHTEHTEKERMKNANTTVNRYKLIDRMQRLRRGGFLTAATFFSYFISLHPAALPPGRKE